MAKDRLTQPIEVWVLTGFLGAGKTTTLNQLLKSPLCVDREQALIINEFGKMGVDGSLIDPGDYTLIEINRGSIFCSCTQGELIETLQTLAYDIRPEQLILEATGIAQPGDLEPLIKTSTYGDCFRIQGVICVVDAEQFVKIAAFMQAAVAQVQCADGILINKTDRVNIEDRKQLQEVLEELNPRACMVETTYGDIPADFLEGIEHVPSLAQGTESPPPNLWAVSFKTESRVDRERFYKTINKLGSRILRLKGNIYFTQGPRFVEVVGERISEKECCYQLGEETQFVVIGWRIEKHELNHAFAGCW